MGVVEGALFAGYLVERRLGSGGMGTVFVVQHPRLPRKDALKVLADSHSGDAEFRARFLREAEIAARLQHPNLVAVRDRGEQDDALWIAMQYVDGDDVAGLIRRGPGGLDPGRAVRILAQAAAGLDEIHRAGLLHRDVKPANILVAEQADGSDRVLVTDFGIARAADDSTTLAEGSTSATLAYAPPEQITGDPMDHRGDVYALGCTLYHMLTGSVPFPRDNPGAVMFAHLHDQPARPSLVNPALSKAFDGVVAKAMAKDPADRYPSCGALAVAAQAALAGIDLTGADAPGHGAAGWRRNPLLAAAMVVIVAVAATVSVLLWHDDPAPVSAAPLPATGPPGVNAAEWGTYAYIVQAFPELLPPSPMSFGYQDLSTCSLNSPDDKPVSYDIIAAPVAELFCIGDGDPVRTLAVTCNADRSPVFPGRFFPRVEGDERWSRPSGSGHVNWGTDVEFDGKVAGQLEVYFDDPSRNFCAVRLHGGSTGTELHAQWWADAPL